MEAQGSKAAEAGKEPNSNCDTIKAKDKYINITNTRGPSVDEQHSVSLTGCVILRSEMVSTRMRLNTHEAPDYGYLTCASRWIQNLSLPCRAKGLNVPFIPLYITHLIHLARL